MWWRVESVSPLSPSPDRPLSRSPPFSCVSCISWLSRILTELVMRDISPELTARLLPEAIEARVFWRLRSQILRTVLHQA
jgi:hypothetical protein